MTCHVSTHSVFAFLTCLTVRSCFLLLIADMLDASHQSALGNNALTVLQMSQLHKSSCAIFAPLYPVVVIMLYKCSRYSNYKQVQYRFTVQTKSVDKAQHSQVGRWFH